MLSNIELIYGKLTHYDLKLNGKKSGMASDRPMRDKGLLVRIKELAIEILGGEKGYRYLGIWNDVNQVYAHHFAEMTEKFNKKRDMVMNSGFSFSWKIRLMNAVVNKSVAYVAMTEIPWREWARSRDLETKATLYHWWVKKNSDKYDEVFEKCLRMPTKLGGWGWMSLERDCELIAMDAAQHFTQRRVSDSILSQFIECEGWAGVSKLYKEASIGAGNHDLELTWKPIPEYELIEPTEWEMKRSYVAAYSDGSVAKGEEGVMGETTGAVFLTDQSPKKRKKEWRGSSHRRIRVRTWGVEDSQYGEWLGFYAALLATKRVKFVDLFVDSRNISEGVEADGFIKMVARGSKFEILKSKVSELLKERKAKGLKTKITWIPSHTGDRRCKERMAEKKGKLIEICRNRGLARERVVAGNSEADKVASRSVEADTAVELQLHQALLDNRLMYVNSKGNAVLSKVSRECQREEYGDAKFYGREEWYRHTPSNGIEDALTMASQKAWSLILADNRRIPLVFDEMSETIRKLKTQQQKILKEIIEEGESPERTLAAQDLARRAEHVVKNLAKSQEEFNQGLPIVPCGVAKFVT
jgi:hypothetical protein